MFSRTVMTEEVALCAALIDCAMRVIQCWTVASPTVEPGLKECYYIHVKNVL